MYYIPIPRMDPIQSYAEKVLLQFRLYIMLQNKRNVVLSHASIDNYN